VDFLTPALSKGEGARFVIRRRFSFYQDFYFTVYRNPINDFLFFIAQSENSQLKNSPIKTHTYFLIPERLTIVDQRSTIFDGAE
jgi:hypothetical protein